MSKRIKAEGQYGGALVNLIVLLCFVVFCAVVYLARHPIMRFMAAAWVIDEPAERADAIIVVGDDNFYADRATRAAELSRQQVAPVVVASGRRLRPSTGISELIEHDLIERGVPKEKILRFPHDAPDTIEESKALAKLAEEQHWKSVIIVTSNYHTRRVRYIFRKVFPEQISVSVAGARDGDFDPERWWEKRKSVRLFGHELLGMVEAYWELGRKEEGTATLFWIGGLCRRVPRGEQKQHIPCEKKVLALYMR
jgi:uncharacterized SAM-binding protein YcdF (DUF218 family)